MMMTLSCFATDGSRSRIPAGGVPNRLFDTIAANTESRSGFILNKGSPCGQHAKLRSSPHPVGRRDLQGGWLFHGQRQTVHTARLAGNPLNGHSQCGFLFTVERHITFSAQHNRPPDRISPQVMSTPKPAPPNKTPHRPSPEADGRATAPDRVMEVDP
jgi:hypothetical protein